MSQIFRAITKRVNFWIILLLAAIIGFAIGLLYPSTAKHRVDETATMRLNAKQNSEDIVDTMNDANHNR